MHRLNKGFTLIELLVVVLIIAILSAIGVMSYDRFIERTRAGEADNLMGLSVYAQGRQLMRKGNYTLLWTALDAAPLSAYTDKGAADHLSADGQTFFTKGGGEASPRNGYAIHFENINGHWFAVAQRVGHWRYAYTLVRPFAEEKVYCLPAAGSNADNLLCVDFMNVDSEADLPADPRLSVPSDTDKTSD